MIRSGPFVVGALLLFEMMHGGPLHLAVGFTLLEVLAAIDILLTFAECDLDFDAAIFPVERKRHDSVALDGPGLVEFADLGLVEEKAPRRLGGVILAVAEVVFVDVSVVEERNSIFDTDEGVADLAFAGPQRLDLGSLEHDAGFKGIEDVKISTGFGIL